MFEEFKLTGKDRPKAKKPPKVVAQEVLVPISTPPPGDYSWIEPAAFERDPFYDPLPLDDLPPGSPADPYGPPEAASGPVCSCSWPWHCWESIYGSVACAACQWPQSLPLVRRFLVIGPPGWTSGEPWTRPQPGGERIMREDPRLLPMLRGQFNRKHERHRAAQSQEASRGH